MNKKYKDEFWATVESILVSKFGIDADEARKRTFELRIRIEMPAKGYSPDVIYHAEPADIAEDLAK